MGTDDLSTSPWYSRRMYRLLKSGGVNVTLEEVAKKEHWWWDTHKANDGGALNDSVVGLIYYNIL